MYNQFPNEGMLSPQGANGFGRLLMRQGAVGGTPGLQRNTGIVPPGPRQHNTDGGVGGGGPLGFPTAGDAGGFGGGGPMPLPPNQGGGLGLGGALGGAPVAATPYRYTQADMNFGRPQLQAPANNHYAANGRPSPQPWWGSRGGSGTPPPVDDGPTGNFGHGGGPLGLGPTGPGILGGPWGGGQNGNGGHVGILGGPGSVPYGGYRPSDPYPEAVKGQGMPMPYGGPVGIQGGPGGSMPPWGPTPPDPSPYPAPYGPGGNNWKYGGGGFLPQENQMQPFGQQPMGLRDRNRVMGSGPRESPSFDWGLPHNRQRF